MARQTGRYVLWTPVAFIAGIGSYFGLPIEPAWPVFAFGGFVAVLVLALRLRMHVPFVLLMIGVMAAGFVTARLRAVLVAPRVLAASTGSVEISGWIDRMEMTSPRRARYYIHLTNAKGIRPDALPDLIRISGKKPPKPLVYGDTITAKARLFSLPTPVTPGGFDFGRRLWFQSVGATGFVFGNITLTGKRPLSWSDKLIAGVQRLRQTMGVYIQAALPGQTGAIATALITGERGGIDRKTRDLLQTAGLAHILAISGLHMTLVAGGVFWLVRALLALSPVLLLDYPIRKWAAMAGLAAGLFYLVISGAAISTQRSFIMLAIMLVAILLDRPAISLRNVAIAALIIAISRPESVVGPGFQMSFLAVTGLIGVHEALHDWRLSRPRRRGGLPFVVIKIAGFFAAIALTTTIAALYTALPAAYHFNRIAVYGLAGNLVALPLFSLFVMPMGIVSVLAMPLGLEAAPLSAMGWGIDLIVSHATKVASLPDARLALARMPALSAIILAWGLLWLVLWRGKLRIAGLGLIGAGLLLASPVQPPDILISKFGRNVAVANKQGKLVLADARRSLFSAENWLKSRGDLATPGEASKRAGWNCKEKKCVISAHGVKIGYLKRGIKLDASACSGLDIVIAEIPLRRKCKGTQATIDRFDLWRGGAQAIYLNGTTAPQIITARSLRGKRPWVIKPVPRRTILLPKPPPGNPV